MNIWYTVVDCGSPPTIVSGSPGTPSGTTYLGAVLYTCDSGYEVSTGVTVATATCMANGNWGPLPTCSGMYQIPLLLHTPNLQRYMINGYTGVSCGDPPSGTNASPGPPSSTTFLGTVLYTCDTGYQISTGVTTADAICRADRTWGPLPTCSGKSWIIKVVHVIYSPQLLTVVPWETPPME